MGKKAKLKITEEKSLRSAPRYMKRVKTVAWFFAALFTLVACYIFYISVIVGPQRVQTAVKQWTHTSALTASRGEIVDCNGKVLATNGTVYQIVLWPKNITKGDESRVAQELSNLLDRKSVV